MPSYAWQQKMSSMDRGIGIGEEETISLELCTQIACLIERELGVASTSCKAKR